VIKDYYPLMATDVSDRVREIAQYRDSDESHIIQKAVETGVEDLWRDVIISKYIAGDLTREEAIEAVGHDVIQRVDTAKVAIKEDVEWGLGDRGA
jgi:predicted transcriptional regulator